MDTGCLDADKGMLGTLRRTKYIGPDASKAFYFEHSEWAGKH